MLCYKGIDNAAYYRLTPDKRGYENLTGCGNTVNCEHPARARPDHRLPAGTGSRKCTSTDSASIWRRCSDATASGFNESSPFFRRAARRAGARLRQADRRALGRRARAATSSADSRPVGASGTTATATRCARSGAATAGASASSPSDSPDRAIIFRHNGRKPTASLNFVTAHDGFTLNDLVSYDRARTTRRTARTTRMAIGTT